MNYVYKKGIGWVIAPRSVTITDVNGKGYYAEIAQLDDIKDNDPYYWGWSDEPLFKDGVINQTELEDSFKYASVNNSRLSQNNRLYYQATRKDDNSYRLFIKFTPVET